MKIVFMGTPDFAEKSLNSLYEAGYNIEAVVTNVDKPKGRGMKLVPSPVKEFAMKKGIKVLQPEKIKKMRILLRRLEKLLLNLSAL